MEEGAASAAQTSATLATNRRAAPAGDARRAEHAPPGRSSSVALLGRGLALVGAGAAKDAGQRVVAFMAGVLEDRSLDRNHRRVDRPRPRKRLRVVDRELIV